MSGLFKGNFLTDRLLTEPAWQSFKQGTSYRDADFLKSLAALEKADKLGKPGRDAQLLALGKVDKQSKALRSAHKSDKKLAAYLDLLGRALDGERKALEQEPASEPEDAEPAIPPALGTQLAQFLRMVRRGDVMNAMIVTASKGTVLLVSRRAIAPTRAKGLKAYLGIIGGAKTLRGHCCFEENAHTFVLQTVTTGLAKRLKAAIWAQAGLRLKVRVRGQEGGRVDAVGGSFIHR